MGVRYCGRGGYPSDHRASAIEHEHPHDETRTINAVCPWLSAYVARDASASSRQRTSATSPSRAAKMRALAIWLCI